jgi:DNA-binding transcriptional MocR family regulator
MGYHPLGLMELRERIAAEYAARGLPTDVEQVMITSGALAGLSATVRALLAAGDRVMLESPTYPNAIAAVRRSGARPVAFPMEPGGWDVPAFEAALRQTAPRAAYLIPDFHNPTGALMPEDQRRAVGAALAATHTVAIVDETVADLAFDPDAPRPRPLAAFHPRTVTLGGASKTYWGGLRIGWIRAPRDLMGPLAEARLTLDLSAPILEQLVLLRLLDGREEILAERRARLRVARESLTAALAEHLPDWSVPAPDGGLCLWVELPQPLSTSLAIAAERHGLVLAPGPQFAVEGGLERFLRLPFTDHSPDVLGEAVRRLALAWREAQAGRAGRHTASAMVA